MVIANVSGVAPVRIESVILTIRGHRVMLDSDLAAIYGVTTKQLNQQMRRNLGRFPADFAFQLTTKEFAALRSQIVTSNARGGRRYRPCVSTEQETIRQLLEPDDTEQTRREIQISMKEQTRRSSLDRATGYTLFPLTPALSLGERENRPPSLGHARVGVCQARVRKTHAWRMPFPLPEGEGQGEGKRRSDCRQMSPFQGAPQYVVQLRPTR